MVWDTGFVDALDFSLAYLSVKHYPTDSCTALGSSTLRDPQTEFPNYLNNTSSKFVEESYPNPTAFTQSKGKKFLMMETNTASCGGFSGLSDSFGAALWALDYSMQMAYRKFQCLLRLALFIHHEAPPTNQSTFHQRTIGPMYSSTLILAETLGNPVRATLFNNITDPSDASDYTALIAIGGQTGTSNATPGQVKVNFALVFLTDDALSESGGDGDQTTITFPTTAYTKLQNTATVDPQVLATSNGDRGGRLGSTRKGSANGGVSDDEIDWDTVMDNFDDRAGMVLLVEAGTG
ncbi:glycoside hydrolase family 79 protein [Collybiopsis luxurians FD-317 M1]|uniref:Glycoside hydrolase family 79 protein n=1 Tax=Collybiopsis luxurians FD-317 M1 TaxID=944289 RepID=A0A0D0C9B5_9AGAR|nr:glycoside hydrolase family 79 protein [Collybiopsis luxurians FD-317 M1]